MLKRLIFSLAFLLLPFAALAASNPANVPHVSTIAALEALGAAAAQYPGVIVDAYYGNKLGGGYFTYTSSTITPDGCVNFAPTAGPGTLVRTPQNPHQIDVTDCGAQPGVTSSANNAAIEAAFAYSRSTYQANAHAVTLDVYNQVTVTWQPGQYIYGGTGIVQNGGNVLTTASPNTVSVYISQSVYFFTNTGQVTNTYVHGINFIGGKGAFHYASTGTNTTGLHVWDHDAFDGYTEAAVANDSSDSPELKFNYNQLAGTTSSKGLVWGGYVDDCEIGNNVFNLNAIHLEIGPRLSGSCNIHDDDFFSAIANATHYDAWIVPGTGGSPGVAQGAAIKFDHNRFGNENLNTAAPRVLIAIENTGSGTNRATYQPLLTWQPSTYYVYGLMFDSNRINGTGTETAPVIASYINEVGALHWHDNIDDASPFTYLIQFVGGTWTASRTNSNCNLLTTGADYAPGNQPFTKGISNAALCVSSDKSGAMGTSLGIEQTAPAGGMEGQITPLASALGNDLSTSAASIANTTSKLGVGTTAAEVTVTGTVGSSFVYLNISPSSAIANVRSQTDFDLAQGTSNTVNSVACTLYNFNDNLIAWGPFHYLLQPGWKTVHVPFIMPTDAQPTFWQLFCGADDYTASTGTDFRIGRVNIYQADQPINQGNLAIIGANAGLFSGAHEIWGGGTSWIQRWWDTGGSKMRCKTGASISASTPTSTGDGATCD